MAAGEPGTAAQGTLAPQVSEDGDTNLGYLFAIYMVTWAAFFGYVFVISRRQRILTREIEYLKRLLNAQDERRTPEADTDG